MPMRFERYIVFTPSNFVCLAHAEGQVVLELDVSDKDLGLAPGLGLMIGMSPPEARTLANVLNSKADEAEAAASRR
jgi:hypothetical protein